MKNRLLILGICAALFCQSNLSAHCQMPCGIYHDNMVFDQIDQYAETMFKGVTVLGENKTNSAKEKNDFIRWIINKENASNEAASLITTYFLQQKIKPGEPDTAARLVSAHKLLFLIVQIKQTVDRKIVDDFADEWEKFKLMFHVEGYECQVEMMKQRQREAAKAKASQTGAVQTKASKPEHDHDHDHEHDDHDHDHDHDHEHTH